MNNVFSIRGLVIHPEEWDREQLDLITRAGLNFLGLHPVGGPGAAVSLEAAIARHTLPQARALRREAAARGITVAYEAHALSWLLPRSLFEGFPQWFRENERGERTADVNLCPSCGEALSYLAERTALLARLLPTGSNRHFYWMDDVCGAPCHCPACRQLSPSDQQMRVVNAMLSGLRQEDPQAQLCYLAYGDALAAPRKVEPLDGVFLEYAPFHRDFTRPLSDQSCEKNTHEIQPLGELIACFGVRNARVLDYWMDNSLYSGWKKPPRPLQLAEAVLQADLDFYADLGFTDVAGFGCYLGADYRALYGLPPIERYGALLGEKTEKRDRFFSKA